MSKVCILYAHDHSRHVIIRRQLNTLLESGFDICVVDQAQKQEPEPHFSYRYVRVNKLEWQFIIKNVWRIIRQIPWQPLHDWFWKQMLGLRTILNAIRMAHMALNEKPDYYIGWDLQSAWAAIFASKFHRRPVIYSADELESEQGDLAPPRRSFLQSLERKLVPKVDYLVAPNHSRAAVYANRYGVRAEPIIVHNCPPTSPVLKSNKLRESLNLAETIRIVLYHGALIPYRSLDKLIESAAYFDPDIALVMMGRQDSFFKQVLEPVYINKRLHDRVFFLPYISPDEVMSYVASADLGIVIYENVNLNNYLCAPIKLYEFMMMKVPIAACNFPELVELFKQYPVGVTFDPHDAKSIAEAVNSYFAKNEGDLAAIKDALDKARQHFTWEKESLKWLDILNVGQNW